jgi:predicted Rossmann-fold nucleotide-binding protein
MLNNRIVVLSIVLAVASSHASLAIAQAAGAGADFNRADRVDTAREAERQRLERVDPPIHPDPLGNALIGGGVTGVMKGAAAGAASAIRGAAIGTAVQQAKERAK